jgi:TRAP-type C4-dicarboxylate transport system substrate-binding protein
MKVSSALSAICAGIAFAISLAGPASAQNFVMKFGTATVNEPQHEFIKLYKEEIEQRSGGRIKVEIYPQSQLGPIPRQIEGLQLGTIEAFIGPADFYVGVDKRYGVFSAPVLFRDRKNAAAALADPELNKAILTLGADKGLIGIGAFAYAQHDYLAKDPIRGFADFKGKKIRVNATPLEREAMARLGATASPMPLNEVLPALQRNVIDGTRSAISIFVTLKYQDVSKLVTVTNDTMLVPVATVGKPWFEKLPVDLQKAVMEAGQAAQKRVDTFTADFMAGMPKRWAELGGEIFTMPEPERQKLVAALKTVGDEVTKDDPPVSAFYQRVRATAAKN